MKKFFVIAAMLFAGFTASAQVNIGAGYVWDFWSIKAGSEKLGTSSMHGVYGGLSYNIPIVEGLGIAPGAYFIWASGTALDHNGKPAKATEAGVTVREGTTYMGLEVPVHLTYSMDMGPGKAFTYIGPAFEYGLSYKYWTKVTGNASGSETSPNQFKKDEDGYRSASPFDVKLGVGFGYNWKFLQFNVGFDFGFLNRAKTKGYEGDAKINANAVHAGVAVVF